MAYKVLPEEIAHEPGALDRLLKEARAAAALNHPNIVTIHDVGLDGGQGYISMEFVEGESYAWMLQRKGRLDLAEVMHFLVSVCQGLDHAHRRGVIHRDIKPSNILLTVEDRVKIVDFGLAQSARASQARAFILGRDFVIPEDVKAIAVPVLAHRLALDTKAKYSGTQKEDVVREILDATPVGV